MQNASGESFDSGGANAPGEANALMSVALAAMRWLVQ
jgi:hypothetical protein